MMCIIAFHQLKFYNTKILTSFKTTTAFFRKLYFIILPPNSYNLTINLLTFPFRTIQEV